MDLKFESQKANALLNLERGIVGVKVVKTKEEYGRYEGKELKVPASYCTAVKKAMSGMSIKMAKDKCSCLGSVRALGFEAAQQSFYDGSGSCRLGLFDDLSIAASVSEKMKLLEPGNYGVIVKPLELFEDEPDVVILMGDAKTMMRVIQGYTCMFGMNGNFTMSGNQAVCIECTSTPILTDDINISFLCSGTRFYAKWKDTEAAVGIPADKFSAVVEGIRRTVNAVEMDDRKKVIIEKLREMSLDVSDLCLNHTYYLQIERERAEREK